ncbi:prolyl oligopeptidase family serine peptidase [Raoultella sp. WB_B2P2-3]|uniref:Prolyl oligopeptidase family serine peptidase n=1 Tax=Raoultella scottii TaxID=3040937 RepID=A0ABU8Z0J7_9ENTR
MKKLIILLHGVGSSGDDLEGLGHFWRQQLPGVTIATPNGTASFDMGPGYQWFSLNGISDATRPERIAGARRAFRASIEAIISQHQLSPGEDRLVLAGFSQGAIMTLDALVSGAFPLTAAISFSGRLASPAPWQANNGTPTLLVHGVNDPTIAIRESETAAQKLAAIGVDVDTYFEPGVGHTITANGARKAAQFLAPLLDSDH